MGIPTVLERDDKYTVCEKYQELKNFYISNFSSHFKLSNLKTGKTRWKKKKIPSWEWNGVTKNNEQKKKCSTFDANFSEIVGERFHFP